LHFMMQSQGVDVMITIISDNCPFSAKNGDFSKTYVVIKIFAKSSSSLNKKRQYFRQIFQRSYFKIITVLAWPDGAKWLLTLGSYFKLR
jgi:hypothetical protein